MVPECIDAMTYFANKLSWGIIIYINVFLRGGPVSENPFYAFVNLVELDQAIDQRVIKREKLQITIGQAEQRLKEQEAALQFLRTKLHELRKSISAVELEHKALQQQEKQKRTKLDAVNTAKEYAALEQELQVIMQQAQEKEDAIFALWADFEKHEAAVTHQEKEIKELQKKIAEEIANIESERKKLSQEIEELTLNRSKYLHTAPEEFVAKYESMRESIKNPIVPVYENNCSACATQIMHADLMQLRRHVIVPCKTCYRLLYMK